VESFHRVFSVLEKPQIIIHPNSEVYIGSLLRETRPKYIIVYDPDIAVIRQVEIYRATNPSQQLQVYFLLYDGSVEEQKYLSSVNRESEAFQSLIREKAVSFSFSFLDVPRCRCQYPLCQKRLWPFLRTKMAGTSCHRAICWSLSGAPVKEAPNSWRGSPRGSSLT